MNPRSFEQRLEQSLLNSIMNDESNRLSFYKIKAKQHRSACSDKSSKQWLRGFMSKNNLLLLSEIYEGLQPTVGELAEDTENKYREFSRDDEKLLLDLDLWKHSKSAMNFGFLENFNSIMGNLDPYRIEHLRDIFNYKPKIIKEKALKSLAELEKIMAGKRYHEKEQVFHFNTDRLEENIYLTYKTLRANNAILKREIEGCKAKAG